MSAVPVPEVHNDWRTNMVTLALLSGVFQASTLMVDTHIASNVIVHETDRFVSVLTYLVIGSWVGLLYNLVNNRVFGKTIDSEFTRLDPISLKFQRFALLAGLLASISTGSYLFVAGEGDPSVLIALANFSLVYLSIKDGLAEKGTLRRRLLIAFFVLFGCFLATTRSLDNGFHVTAKALVLMLGVSSVAKAAGSVYEKKSKDYTNSVNFAFWRFVWLTITANMMVVAIAYSRGILGEVANLLQTAIWGALPWIGLLTLCSFFSNNFRIQAQQRGNLSTVGVISTCQVILAVPFTLLVSYVAPAGTFMIPTDPTVWLVRIIGAVIIALGILYTAKMEKKAEVTSV